MGADLVIPLAERYRDLKEFLFARAKNVAQIRASKPNLIPDGASPFLYLVFPWIAMPTSREQEIIIETRRAEFETAGFDGSVAVDALKEILMNDKHLRECCVGVGQLAHFLDIAFVTPAAPLISKAAPEQIDELFKQFESTAYAQGRFRAISLCHLFNFEAQETSLRFGDVRVERLDGPTISRILGELSFASFIHPVGTGNYFVITEQEGPCDDHIQWLIECKNSAEIFTHVLQYFKDGIVHIDYAAAHFAPEWVNQIRKWGIFFIGNPRRLPYEDSHKFYKITADEKMVVEKWWRAYQTPSVWERISDLSHPLRQANLRAAEYFELNHSQEKAIDRLISLAIALEAVFSPSDRGELTFRISQSLSQLVGTTPEHRVEIFKQTKEFYTRRSKLIHGQYDVDAYLENRFVSHLECDIWASAIRKAILRFLVLYLRGHNDRDMVLYELSRAALDAQLADDLRDKSDPDAFLAELFPPNPPQLRQ